MASKLYLEEEIKEREQELESNSDALCVGTLSLSAYSSSARAAMLTQHLVQAVTPTHPEIPGVFTGHENLFGKFSGTYCKTESKLEVIHKIVKFEGYSYTLVVYDPKAKMYDIIQRNEVKEKAESCGFRYNNTEIDKYEEGDIIKKGKMLYSSPTLDEYENFRYGKNANVVYVISQETIEDAVSIREGFAKQFKYTKVESEKVPINDNDIPLNMYGDSMVYKSFPDIGEWTKKSILCATRRKNKLTDQYGLKNNNLRKIFPNDSVYQVHGDYQMVDINIWSNKDIDDIPDLKSYSQIKKYYKKILKYWQEVYDNLGKIIEFSKLQGKSYSQELSRLYAKARDVLDPTCRWTENDRMFSNMIVEFTFAKEEPLRKGSKVSGRFGNKSIVSYIIPDDEMGVTEDGIVPDIRIDALGILARLNSGQLFEQELNWVAKSVKDRMLKMKNDSDKEKILFKFMNMVNSKQCNSLIDYCSALSQSEKVEFMQEILTDRIYIHQEPLESITGDGMRKLYEEFKPKKTTIRLKDSDGEYNILRDIIVAEEYIIRLNNLTHLAGKGQLNNLLN